jgi:uncharacterized protein (TIGR02246 family)
MRIFCLLMIPSLLSISSFGQNQQTYAPADAAALAAMPGTFERCWNNHNIDSMGTLLTDDVDFVNVAGTWFKGKAATVADHKDSHSMMFRNSVFAVDSMETRYVRPDLAILHIGWGITGDLDPDGKPRTPRHGIFTWVAVKQRGRWLLLAVSNVNIRASATPTK